MEFKTITIDDAKLFINDELVDRCLVSGFHVETDNTEDELVEITLKLISPKTKVIIPGITTEKKTMQHTIINTNSSDSSHYPYGVSVRW